MPRSSIDWTLETIQTLTRLWAEGHSTAEIARRMGRSKNAIVGKAHRLNLPGRPSPITRGDPKPRKIPAQRRKPSLPPLQVMTALPKVVEVKREPPAADRPKPTGSERQGSSRPEGVRCCWPIGEPGRTGFHFCGDPIAALGRSYCDDHCKLAYVKKTPARRDLEGEAHVHA